MKSVVMHRVYKTCPECGFDRAKYYVDCEKIGEDINWSDISKSTITYQEYNYFICMSSKCGHSWREK